MREIEARGGVDGLTGAADLFARTPTARRTRSTSTISAPISSRSPTTPSSTSAARSGLPRELRRADGAAAVAPGPQAARLMQEVVWDVVRTHPLTGVAPPR